MIDEETLGFGRRAAECLLGLDRLFRAESGDPDGLVVVNLDGSGTMEPVDFGSYGQAREAFADLGRRAADLSAADRRVYYADLCQASVAFIEWRERTLPLREQLNRFLQVPAEPASDADLDALQSALRALLTALGFQRDLAAQCAAWEERHRVPAEEVPAVLGGLLDEAWTQTAASIGMPAERSDAMTVRAVSGVAFNARCDYAARTIELNTDPVLTRPALAHLAVHEGYPGHYLQFKRRELAFAEGRAPADVLLSVVNTASSSVFEGIADSGLVLLGWLDDPDLRVQQILNRHRAGVGTGAAWRLHQLGWSMDRVADWLRGRTLVGGEGWIANRLAFISPPARAVLIWSYWWGEPVVGGALERIGPGDRGRFVPFLYDQMHSNRSVGMFAP